MIRYYTVKREAQAEQVIEKSKFIAHVKNVEKRADADTFFDEIRRNHKDATHNVPAFVIGEKSELQWASDDGEPQGTSGAPMVQMLVKEGITNVALIVTRYFGGTKLGKGGLVRAYTSSARLGIEAAEVVAVKDVVKLKYIMDYACFNAIEQLEKQGVFELGEVHFTESVELEVSADPEREPEVKIGIENASSGRARLIKKCVDKRAFSVVI